jgi:hypothetical protein
MEKHRRAQSASANKADGVGPTPTPSLSKARLQSRRSGRTIGTVSSSARSLLGGWPSIPSQRNKPTVRIIGEWGQKSAGGGGSWKLILELDADCGRTTRKPETETAAVPRVNHSWDSRDVNDRARQDKGVRRGLGVSAGENYCSACRNSASKLAPHLLQKPICALGFDRVHAERISPALEFRGFSLVLRGTRQLSPPSVHRVANLV